MEKLSRELLPLLVPYLDVYELRMLRQVSRKLRVAFDVNISTLDVDISCPDTSAALNGFLLRGAAPANVKLRRGGGPYGADDLDKMRNDA